MDCLGWDSPQALASTMASRPCEWSNPQHAVSDSSIESSADQCIIGSNIDLADQLFHPCPEIRGINLCNTSSSPVTVAQMVEQIAPALDSLSSPLNLNLLQRENTSRSVADAVLAKRAAGTTWGEALTAELCCSPLMNTPYSTSSSGGLATNFGASLQSQIVTDNEDEKLLLPITDSIESLDCLLSVTNSTTEKLAEEDVVSAIFPNCRSLWSLSCRGAISSGESENNGSNESNKDVHRKRLSETDEAMSRGSSNLSTSPPGPTLTGSSSKRSKEQEEEEESNSRANLHYLGLLPSDASTAEGGCFRLITENLHKSKKPTSENHHWPLNINFVQPNSSGSSSGKPDDEAITHMKEMIYRAAAFRPVNFGMEVVEKPKRKNVRISSDPQTVAARQRRERVSDRIKILQRLVPGGTRMDTASILDEAANYLKFLRSQVDALQNIGHKFDSVNCTPSNILYSPTSNHPYPMQQNFHPYPKP